MNLTHQIRDGRVRQRISKLAVGVGLIVSCAAGGCYKSLFPHNSPRTQYETYDRMRNRYTPLEEPDVFGNPQPALRARLSPR